jgi:hypothetical protein
MKCRFKSIAFILLCALAASLCPVTPASAQMTPFAFWKKSGGAPADPCAGKAIGEAGTGTTARCAGTFNGGKYMVTADNAWMYLWALWAVANNATGATSMTDGAANTATVAAITPGVDDYPAPDYCANLTEGGYDDWFLPALNELGWFYNNAAVLGFDTGGGRRGPGRVIIYPGVYWSSTEYTARPNCAWIYSFFSNAVDWVWKSDSNPRFIGFRVRCARRY